MLASEVLPDFLVPLVPLVMLAREVATASLVHLVYQVVKVFWVRTAHKVLTELMLYS